MVKAQSKQLDNSYQKLVANIKDVIAKGQKEIERQRAITYWKVGELVSKDILKNKNRAGYGDKLFVSLSKDLGIDKNTLHDAVGFYREFPILRTCGEFNWSKYRKLLTVKDEKSRQKLITKAKQENLTARQLALEVKKANEENTAVVLVNPDPIKIEKGTLNLAKLIAAPADSSQTAKDGYAWIDMGFKVMRQLKLSSGININVDSFVEIRSRSNILPLEVNDKKFKESARFTYVAYLARIIDGDTLLVNVDLGLGTIIEERLRLRGINAAELPTPEGVKAKKYLESVLKNCPVVVIQTTKGVDMYSRYLADIFYCQNEIVAAKILENGQYLNQELLDKQIVSAY